MEEMELGGVCGVTSHEYMINIRPTMEEKLPDCHS